MLFRTAAGGGGVGHNQSGKSDQHVDDAGQNAHAAKQEGNQIEVEKSDRPQLRAPIMVRTREVFLKYSIVIS